MYLPLSPPPPLALSSRHSQIGQISLKSRSAQLFRSTGPARTSTAASPLGIVIVVIIVCCVVQINSQTSVLQVCRDSKREKGAGEGELRHGTSEEGGGGIARRVVGERGWQQRMVSSRG